MIKDTDTTPKDTSGTMMSQKTNEDFNKKKPTVSDVNPFKSKQELSSERLEAYKYTADEALEKEPIPSEKKIRRQRINLF
jgi:hypothetical protein